MTAIAGMRATKGIVGQARYVLGERYATIEVNRTMIEMRTVADVESVYRAARALRRATWPIVGWVVKLVESGLFIGTDGTVGTARHDAEVFTDVEKARCAGVARVLRFGLPDREALADPAADLAAVADAVHRQFVVLRVRRKP